jgi:xanthine dehydrogenase accessory factor
MWDQFLKKTGEMLARGEAFAVATVVRALPPTSGKPGDKALVYSDGHLWGWIGGGCAQPVVAKEALKALVDGRPRLVRISPSDNPAEEGIVDYTMTCHSGGAMDIYIEPVLPRPHLVLLGRSRVAQTLAQLARVVGYAVTVVSSEPAGEGFTGTRLIEAKDYSLEQAKVDAGSFIVVSTQGEDDEGALEQALKTGASYIAFVASRTKAEKVSDYLKTRGIPAERLKAVRAPAGLDLHAESPEEIAVAVLAQLVQVRGQRQSRTVSALPVPGPEAKDPICGMSVNRNSAKHTTEYQGKMFFFCCAGCKQTFEREPARYAGKA